MIEIPEIPGYRIDKVLGQGGMSTVYLGFQENLKREVAIKILPGHLAEDEEARHRFSRETQTISLLKHPNIVEIYGYGEKDGSPFMIIEYINGPDLRIYLKDCERLTVEEARLILEDIAAALDFAHQEGIVHRDIKPSNVMLGSASEDEGRVFRVVLTDFGLAKILGGHTQLTRSGVVGTLDYIAPEQIQGSEEISGQTDVYSLGVMAYEMVTGERPFDHNNPAAILMDHMKRPAPDPRDVVSDLPGQAAKSIMRAMSKKPEERFSSAGEFISAWN